MGFSLNNLGDTLLKIGQSTLKTGTFYATAKALNSPCNMRGSVFGCGTFGGYASYPAYSSYPIVGCGMGGFSQVGMGMGMLNSYNTQMAIGQAYGQGYALGEQIKAQGGNGMFGFNFNFQNLQNPTLNLNNNANINPTKNEAAEKFESHPTELGEQFETNSRNSKTTQFVMSDWNKKAEGKEKDEEYKTYTSNFAKSYIAYMDEESGNKDNEISQEEYIKHNMKSDLPEGASAEEIAEYKKLAETSFKKLDQNGDGKVDWKEMAALFSTYDSISDGTRDGKITMQEMELGFSGLTNASSTQMDTKLRNEYTKLFGKDESK